MSNDRAKAGALGRRRIGDYTKAFKNIRFAQRTDNHIIIKATVNISELFSGFKANMFNNKMFKRQEFLAAIEAAIGYRLLDSLHIVYPNISIMTTDKEYLDAVIGKSSYSLFMTKYLQGRWKTDEPFEMYLCGSGNYSLYDFLTEAIGASISFSIDAPYGKHLTYLILSQNPIISNVSNELTLAKNADEFEKIIIDWNAIMIYPEFDECSMSSKFERDEIFSNYELEPLIPGMPATINDIYIIGGERKIIDIIKRIELP